MRGCDRTCDRGGRRKLAGPDDGLTSRRKFGSRSDSTGGSGIDSMLAPSSSCSSARRSQPCAISTRAMRASSVETAPAIRATTAPSTPRRPSGKSGAREQRKPLVSARRSHFTEPRRLPRSQMAAATSRSSRSCARSGRAARDHRRDVPDGNLNRSPHVSRTSGFDEPPGRRR
jgi:hypothetical protein